MLAASITTWEAGTSRWLALKWLAAARLAMRLRSPSGVTRTAQVPVG
jgi:hypothetical protein